MSRVLLSWELGSNYGHISKLMRIATHLKGRGHHVQFVLKNIDLAERALHDGEFSYTQSPLPKFRKEPQSKPASFADILARAGFGNVNVLDDLVQSWRDIFKSVQPDVVLAQYAPVTQFSARLFSIPCLSINTGFECPPNIAPFPSFRPSLQLKREHLLEREKLILGCVNKVSSHYGKFSYRHLKGVLKSDVNLLTTLPELDHYQQRRNGRYIGPILFLEHGEAMQWRKHGSKRIFVYLRPFPGIEELLTVLAESQADVIAHIPGLDPKLTTIYKGTSLRISSSMVRLAGLQKDMDLAITHAGHGTVCAALLAGVPMLVIPTTIEQYMMSENLKRLEVAIVLSKNSTSQDFSSALERLLAHQSYHEKAMSIAKKYVSHNQEQMLGRITNTIERLPAWKRDFHA